MTKMKSQIMKTASPNAGQSTRERDSSSLLAALDAAAGTKRPLELPDGYVTEVDVLRRIYDAFLPCFDCAKQLADELVAACAPVACFPIKPSKMGCGIVRHYYSWPDVVAAMEANETVAKLVERHGADKDGDQDRGHAVGKQDALPRASDELCDVGEEGACQSALHNLIALVTKARAAKADVPQAPEITEDSKKRTKPKTSGRRIQ